MAQESRTDTQERLALIDAYQNLQRIKNADDINKEIESQLKYLKAKLKICGVNLDEKRDTRDTQAELIGGKLIIADNTTTTHNQAVLEIRCSLLNFIKATNGKDKVYSNAVRLYCNELSGNLNIPGITNNLFTPDVMTVSDEAGIKDDGVHVAPTFVAEITSEASSGYDYLNKALIYRHIGVKEYWIVDLQRKAIVRYLSENNFVPEDFTYPDVKRVAVHTYPTLEIDLSSIFEYSVN